MRRETRSSDSNQGMKSRLYLIGGVLALAVLAFVISLFVYSNKANKEANLSKMNTDKITDFISNTTEEGGAEDLEQASTSIGKTVEESEEQEKIAINTSIMNKTEEETKNTVKNTNTVKEEKETKQNKEEQKEEKKEEKKQDPTFKFPVEGEICKEYAKDTLIYSTTLGEWVTHPGIDIRAESTTVVKAAADGKVKAIKNDPRYGLTIILEHDNGFTSVYSNLLTSEFVVEGEEVKQGQTIGTVGNTATFEIADESHLHFEILKDNVAVDPNVYLK